MKKLLFSFLIISISETVLQYESKSIFSLTEFLGAGDSSRQSKTEKVIEERAEFGRMILLVCTKTCAKQRSDIPLWLKEFNRISNNNPSDDITYYYHKYRQPTSFLNATDTTQFPIIIYFIGNKKLIYDGDITSKKTFHQWLSKIDKLTIFKADSYSKINHVLSSTTNCSNKFMIFAESPTCLQFSWQNAARVATMFGVQPVKLELPLDRLMHVSLFKRLPRISESLCHWAVLLYENNYSELNDNISPYAVTEWLSALLPTNEGDCPALLEPYWHPINDELTDLEQIYFAADLEIAERNRRVSYILVGLTGGLAVIVLAYSIFWGLNGSAFTK